MVKIIDRCLDKAMAVLSHYKDKREVQSLVEGIDEKYRKLTDKRVLTSDQEKEIQTYYKSMSGHKVPTAWHRFLYSRRGEYSKKYISNGEYKTNIVGRLNIYPLKRAYTDKNVSDLILPKARQPRILLKNMNGYYYFQGKAMEKSEAVNCCGELGEVILKPSLESRGKGVQMLNIHGGVDIESGEALWKIFDEYRADFLIEEKVEQHEDMMKLNPTSVNTIRLLTYRNGMEVHVVYSVIRIGRMNQVIDNESAGGISANINTDGTLARYAYGNPGVDKVEYTDTGIRLEGYKIPSYTKAINFVKQQHLQMPYFNLVGWDIAIEKDGEPIMIEFNITPDLSQSAYGPGFGEYTELMLHDAYQRYNTWSKYGQDWMWKSNYKLRNRK